MEGYSEYHEVQGVRRSLDYLLKSKSFNDEIEKANFLAEQYIDSLEQEVDLASDDYLGSLLATLNYHLNLNEEEWGSEWFKVVGEGYFGDPYEIESDTSSIEDDQPTNSKLATYRNLCLEGFRFMHVPGEVGNRAMLCFSGNIGKYSEMIDNQDLEEPDDMYEDQMVTGEMFYYFKPEDIASLRVGELMNSELITKGMLSHAFYCRDKLEDFRSVPSSRRTDLINELEKMVNDNLMPMLSDEEVHVDAGRFYEVDDIDGKRVINGIINMSNDGVSRILPVGIFQGCSFIESVLSTDGNMTFVEELLELEPCMVLTDEDFKPLYFVPISSVNDIAII